LLDWLKRFFGSDLQVAEEDPHTVERFAERLEAIARAEAEARAAALEEERLRAESERPPPPPILLLAPPNYRREIIRRI